VREEVLILGGGPAGAAAGRLLAAWGHRVRLITKPEAPGPSLGVSLPPSTTKLFDLLGVQGAIEDARFVRSSGNTVWWGVESRVESFASGQHGWQAPLGSLARVLLTAAQASGVEIERRVASEGEVAGTPAALVLDCTGRAGLIARARAGRQYEAALRTVALLGVWRLEGGWPVPDDSHTLIESYEDGWAWSVPTEPGVRHVAVMVDPRVTDLVRGGGRAQVYDAEIGKTKKFAALLRDATLEGGPWGWDASRDSSNRYSGDGWLAVGDAGSFIDPLSSVGVKKALASGWLAAVVAHTVINRSSMGHVALQFFQAREADVYAAFLGLTRRFLAAGAARHAHPFWTDRAEAADSDAAAERPEDRGGSDSAVAAAFETIRQAPAIALSASPSLRVAPQAAIGGNEIVLEPRLVGDGLPSAGIRYVRDVDMVTLVDLAPAFDHVPDLFGAYCRRAGPVALPDFLAALATAVARKWLVWRR
jgi:clorobiocin biosynthesis protein Clo-hal/halogenation protein CepH